LLPAKFQNFKTIPHVLESEVGYYGGSVALADYCPYIQEFTWRSNNVVVRGSHCMYEENNPSHDRNFALENYGPKSKCFDHNDKMWEEMNCEQVRQWQHWGSGCYKYHCKNGRLHIEVMNYSFTCFYPRQQIQVSLLAHSWLHTGSLVCPPCEEVCGDEFLKKGEKCRKGVVPPKMYQYHYDSMTCGAPRGQTRVQNLYLVAPTLVLAIILQYL